MEVQMPAGRNSSFNARGNLLDKWNVENDGLQQLPLF